MPYLVETLLFLAPIALCLLWIRLKPDLAPADPRFIPLLAAGAALALAATIAFGFFGRREPGSVYVPAELGSDGMVQPGHTDPAR